MFNNKKSSQTILESTSGSKTDTTIIGSSSFFDGTLKSSGIIRVDGAFSGEMIIQGNVIVGDGGNIKGNINADKVTIAGRVEGNIHCSGALELTSNGQLFGDIEVKSIHIDDGAVFQGKCIMSLQSASAGYATDGNADTSSESEETA